MASVEALAPYQPNAQGLTEVLIDLKSTMPSQTVFKVTGYETTCFENVTQVLSPNFHSAATLGAPASSPSEPASSPRSIDVTSK